MNCIAPWLFAIVAGLAFQRGCCDDKELLRRSVPEVTAAEKARLKDIQGEFKGRFLIYQASNDSGKSPKEAILITSFNTLSGIESTRHLLISRYPGSKIQMIRYFELQGRHYHEWEVAKDGQRAIRIFIDATYFHGVL